MGVNRSIDCEWPTPRLQARRPEGGDLPPYEGLFLDSAVGEWLRPQPLEPFRRADIREMLGRDVSHWVEHGFGPWALIDRGRGAFVGRGGLAWTDLEGERAVELPWAIDPGRWGEGLASEAAGAAIAWARSLGLREVVAMITPTNLASQRVAEKAGLRLRGNVDRRGIPHLLYRLEL